MAKSAAGKAALRAAFQTSDCFDSNADALINRTDPALKAGIDNYCDLASLVEKVAGQFAANADVVNSVAAVQAAISSTVRANRFDDGVPGRESTDRWAWESLSGVSIYAPFGQDDWKRGLYGQLAVADTSQWDELLNSYWNNVDAPDAPSCPQGGCDLPDGPLGLGNEIYLPIISR